MLVLVHDNRIVLEEYVAFPGLHACCMYTS
jgi:hypothetical protein